MQVHKIFCLSLFFIPGIIMGQNLSDCQGGLYGGVWNTSIERQYKIGHTNAPTPPLLPQTLVGDYTNSAYLPLSDAVKTFIQTVIAAADAWSAAGTGTFLYTGETNTRILPDFYTSE